MKTAEETKELFKPFVYPYSGSSYMTDTIDEDAIEMNAQECLKIAKSYAEQFKSKWISVEDQLPKTYANVLVSFVNEAAKTRRTMAFFIPEFTREGDGDYDEEYLVYHEERDKYYWPEGWYEFAYESETHYKLSCPVTHWMLLPENPEVTKS